MCPGGPSRSNACCSLQSAHRVCVMLASASLSSLLLLLLLTHPLVAAASLLPASPFPAHSTHPSQHTKTQMWDEACDFESELSHFRDNLSKFENATDGACALGGLVGRWGRGGVERSTIGRACACMRVCVCVVHWHHGDGAHTFTLVCALLLVLRHSLGLRGSCAFCQRQTTEGDGKSRPLYI